MCKNRISTCFLLQNVYKFTELPVLYEIAQKGHIEKQLLALPS